LLLALTWGGQGDGWAQPDVLIGFALAAVALVAFLRVSRGKSWAVVPLDLFSLPVVARANIALFLVNLGYIGVPMFLPLYLQLVRGYTASESGVALLPQLFGILLGSMVAGRVARRSLSYKPVLVIGGVIAVLAAAAMMLMTATSPHWLLSVNLFIFGLGLGPAQGMFTLAIQSAVGHDRVGVATASAQFFRQIGATVGVAVFGALLTFNLTRELPQRVPVLVVPGEVIELSQAQTLAMNPTALHAALAARGSDDPARAAAAQSGLKASFAIAIEALFPVTLAVLLLAWLVTLSVPALKLRGREAPPPRVAEAAA